MKITSSSQTIDLEEEEPKGRICMEMVEGETKRKQVVTGSMPQSEINTKIFSRRKHIFS
jgi:hypothetical protein